MPWTVERANDWYASKGFVFGFNYVTSSAVNSTEMWQRENFEPETIKRELKMASDAGYNSCRVFLPFIVWENERGGFFSRFDEFLSISAGCGITVMPILFDDVAFAGRDPYGGPQDAPVKGVHNSGWTPSPGFAIADDPSRSAELEAYVKSIISAHKDDERIIVWDLYNEPCNSNRVDKSLPLLTSVFRWARECAPSQPLTAAVWNRADAGAEYERFIIENSDVVSFHDYGSANETVETVARLRRHGRPLLCTEWLNRYSNNRFETHLPLWKNENIGAYQWGLVAGKTQTYLSWDNELNGKDAMPKVWQHDMFYADGRPYDENEIEFIKTVLSK